MKKKAALAALLCAATLALGGCDLVNGLMGGQEAPMPVPVVVPPAPVPVMPTLPVAPVAPVPAAPAAVATADFQWTEAPAVNLIPDAPLAGMANGQPFTVQSVIFEPGTTSWKMIIRDQPLPNPTDIASDGQYISIDLPTPPTVGMTWMRPMSYGDGFFQVRNDPANPEQTTSWNADNAWALEITAWQAADWTSGGAAFQDAGRASGRIAVCYKGAGDLQNSWVAGKFENAVIRYMGEPYWLKGVASGGAKSSSGGGGKSSLEKKVSDALGKLPSEPPATEEPPAAEEPPPASGGAGAAKPALTIDVNKLKGRLEELKKKAHETQNQ